MYCDARSLVYSKDGCVPPACSSSNAESYFISPGHHPLKRYEKPF